MKGYGLVREVVQRTGYEGLHTTIVWVPVLEQDTLSAAIAQAECLRLPRVMHLWDGDREVNPYFAESLALEGPGWDLYLVYRAGVRWERKLPPTPTFWMHQLSLAVGASPTRYLKTHPHLLGRTIGALLSTRT